MKTKIINPATLTANLISCNPATPPVAPVDLRVYMRSCLEEGFSHMVNVGQTMADMIDQVNQYIDWRDGLKDSQVFVGSQLVFHGVRLGLKDAIALAISKGLSGEFVQSAWDTKGSSFGDSWDAKDAKSGGTTGSATDFAWANAIYSKGEILLLVFTEYSGNTLDMLDAVTNELGRGFGARMVVDQLVGPDGVQDKEDREYMDALFTF